MEKKILFICFTIIGALLLAEFYYNTIKSADTTNKNAQGTFCEFVHIGDTLCYDKTTFIVYLKNVTSDGHGVYTPYYASNGAPYKYNPATDSLEEIKQSNDKNN